VEGTSAKFWEISTSGSDVTVRFGRLGTEGQTKTKSLEGAAAAQRHADKLIEEKTGKGYVEK
jgi:predicted DNA-binding WGR domain protein